MHAALHRISQLLLSTLACLSGAPLANAAQSPDAGCGDFLEAWVDPVNGVDPAAAAGIESQVNDPDHPYRRLQTAIVAVRLKIEQQYCHQSQIQGIVYALPGIYGPSIDAALPSSGDSLPILIADRVHVQGLGARGTVVRGKQPNIILGFGQRPVFWPDPTLCATGFSHPFKEVLIDFSSSSPITSFPPQAVTTNSHYVGYGLIRNFAPWADQVDTAERLDGFTFEGGDVQVYFGAPIDDDAYIERAALSARISNCLFEMRHDLRFYTQSGSWVPAPNPLGGPTFGILIAPPYVVPDNGGSAFYPGYYDQDVLIANNTFVMGRWDPIVQPNGGWQYCKPDAVALMSVTDTACQFGSTASEYDPNQEYRGLMRPMVLNNLFRTAPGGGDGTTTPMAMLGVHATDGAVDWLVDPNAPPAPANDGRATNAFASALVGTTNGRFVSKPVSSVFIASHPNVAGPTLDVPNCDGSGTVQVELENWGEVWYSSPPPLVATPLPFPRVEIWNGPASPSGAVDPGFVGEYLSIVDSALRLYVDWRLLPSSAMRNEGYYDTAGVDFKSGKHYVDPACTRLLVFANDCEWYGNPRIVDHVPDIGFDELHLYTMAGSYANESVSHGTQSFMDLSAVTSPTKRYWIVRELAPAPPTLTATHGTIRTQTLAPTKGWTRPPAVLSLPLQDISSPVGYKTVWISRSNSNPDSPTYAPNPWRPASQGGSLSDLAPRTWTHPGGPAGQAPHTFLQTTFDDQDAGPAPPNFPAQGYFNTQLELDVAGVRRWSNLQWEYR